MGRVRAGRDEDDSRAGDCCAREAEAERAAVGRAGDSKAGRGSDDKEARGRPDPGVPVMKSSDDEPVVSRRLRFMDDRDFCRDSSASIENEGRRVLVKLYIPGGYIVVIPRTEVPAPPAGFCGELSSTAAPDPSAVKKVVLSTSISPRVITEGIPPREPFLSPQTDASETTPELPSARGIESISWDMSNGLLDKEKSGARDMECGNDKLESLWPRGEDVDGVKVLNRGRGMGASDAASRGAGAGAGGVVDCTGAYLAPTL